MNLLNSPNPNPNTSENADLLFVNFNQDCTSLAVGTRTGYRLYQISSSEKLEEIYNCDGEDIWIVERLFASSLVAVVSLSAPRKLRVCHFKKGTEICNYCYANTVLSVRLNRNRLVVCLEERIDIHNIRDMKVIHTIRDIPSNPRGLCALSIDNDKSYLAYPGNSQVGEVQIFDTINLKAVTMIPAHDSTLASIAFDSSGSKLATASEKGTVIRVFTIPNGKRVFEFRRGVRRNAAIYSLSFSPDSLYLSASSNLETIHIFRLEAPKEKPPDENQSWMGIFNRAMNTAANYLPSQAQDVLQQDRAFATVHLPQSAINFKNISALTFIQKNLRLLMACADGFFYIYEVNTQIGGECKLLSQTSILTSNKTIFTSHNNTNNQQQQTGSSSNIDQHTTSYAEVALKNTGNINNGCDKTNLIDNELCHHSVLNDGKSIKLHDSSEFPCMNDLYKNNSVSS